MIHPPLKLLLGADVWQDDIVATLVGAGHEVSCLPSGYDAFISYDAWRIPPGTSKDDVLKHIGMIVKQVRLTKHVQDTEETTSSKRADKKPRKPAVRKRKPKEASSVVSTEGQPGEASQPEGDNTGS